MGIIIAGLLMIFIGIPFLIVVGIVIYIVVKNNKEMKDVQAEADNKILLKRM